MVDGVEPLTEKPDEKPTLHDTVEAAFQEHVVEDVSRETPEDTPVEETAEEKAERLRDEKGRFVAKGKTDVETTEPITEPEITPEPAVKPAPSSWKKDYHEQWGTLPTEIQDYIQQRESQFAQGVSTYKAEFDRVAPIAEAMEPFLPELEANNIDPSQWITNLGNAHYNLAKGTPEQKLSMFMKLAQDYQIPVQNLFTQGEDGKVYFNPQVQQYQPQAQQAPDINKLVESKFAEFYSQQQIQSFTSETDSEGNPRYPHYEAVRETMAQLLESGLADDLNSAYDAALRHPRHADIFDEVSQQEQARKEADAAAKRKAEAERARRNAVSPKTGTPSGGPAETPKGVRGAVESAWEAVENTGRI